MKTPILSCFLALSLGTALNATPLCDAFLFAEEMPKKYRKLAPVLSGDATDWIIPADQMDEKYAPDAQALLLLESIANAFQDRETQLAILMPPPRPVVAGQAALERLAGGSVSFDTEAVGDSFHQMIADLRGVGIVAPDLLDTAMRSDTLRADYYYRHDTHWTPAGAAESVVALADAVADAQIAAFSDSETLRPSFNDATEILSERGSLADMARNVCGVAIDEVDRPIPHFPDQGLGLLDDTPDRPRILLAGSSFSNRYKRDAYRVADALAGALQADVENHSVSGGGAIGALEGIVLSGNLASSTSPDLVIWELPYTEGIRPISVLRQLLGALRLEAAGPISDGDPLSPTGENKISLANTTATTLAFRFPGATFQRIKVDLRFEDGRKKTVKLQRKKHVPANLRSDWWAVSLEHLPSPNLVSATVRYDASALSGAPSVAILTAKGGL